jgi:hypothetical protein
MVPRDITGQRISEGDDVVYMRYKGTELIKSKVVSITKSKIIFDNGSYMTVNGSQYRLVIV